MPERPEVSVVMPCRNEVATVGACVRGARAALDRCGYSGEVVVCDNGSIREAESAGARVVHRCFDVNTGLAWFRDGF